MKPHDLYVQTNKSSLRLKVSEPKMHEMKGCNPKGLSKSVKHTKWLIALAYDEMNIHEKGVSNYEKQMCKMW